MKFITVRDFRSSPAQIWKQLLSEREFIITNNGKPIALLTPLTDETLEDTIKTIRKVRAINAVKKMQEISIQKGTNTLSEEEIEKEIKKSRESQK
jgi:antitoxin (DNA-binding transcriptional repressor) of toxin-antitoxin stability system